MSRGRWQQGSVVARGSSFFIRYRTREGKEKWEGLRPGAGFPTRAAAQDRLTEVLASLQRGDYVEPQKITLEEFANRWIDERVSLKGSTASSYRSMIRRHLVPAFGSLRLHELDVQVLQNWVNDCCQDIAEGDLSVKFLLNMKNLLSSMLGNRRGNSAIRLGYLRYNPALALEMPSAYRAPIVPPTREEVWRLLDAAREWGQTDKRGKFAWHSCLFAACTGVRRGELLAVRFCDIDWQQREVVISQAVGKVDGRGGLHRWPWQIGPTKTNRSRRVGIGEDPLRILRQLQIGARDSEEFIFTPARAGLRGCYPFLDPDYLDSGIFAPVRAAAGVNSNMRFHDLRHFFASMLIAQGENAKYVCDQMGHSSIQVTFDTYGHLFPQARKEASDKFNEALFGGRQRELREKLREIDLAPARRKPPAAATKVIEFKKLRGA